MTGLFPQIGGGTGLNLGKDRLRDMLESFGAKVTSAVSGKTNLLVVGEEPGSSKVSKARASGKCQLIRVEDLVGSIHGRVALEQATPPQIEAFSSGYFGNALRIGGDGYDGW